MYVLCQTSHRKLNHFLSSDKSVIKFGDREYCCFLLFCFSIIHNYCQYVTVKTYFMRVANLFRCRYFFWYITFASGVNFPKSYHVCHCRFLDITVVIRSLRVTTVKTFVFCSCYLCFDCCVDSCLPVLVFVLFCAFLCAHLHETVCNSWRGTRATVTWVRSLLLQR